MAIIFALTNNQSNNFFCAFLFYFLFIFKCQNPPPEVSTTDFRFHLKNKKSKKLFIRKTSLIDFQSRWWCAQGGWPLKYRFVRCDRDVVLLLSCKSFVPFLRRRNPVTYFFVSVSLNAFLVTGTFLIKNRLLFMDY